MMTSLQFEGTVTVPAPSNCTPCGVASALVVDLDLLVAEFAEALSGSFELVSSGVFQQLEAVGQFDVLGFLALSIAEGQTADVEVLLGRPPVLLGSAGVFPLVGSASLVFELRDMTALGGTVLFTITSALQAGDTAAVAANRINAAALLAGVGGLVASVVGGQIQLSGTTPGALQAINVTTANAGAGFPTTGLRVGLGSPVFVSRVFVASLGAAAGFTGEDVWVRGGVATLQYVAAGS